VLVNLGLGLFNLIPAFPMDGGRVLRALLSGWLGRATATSIAASIGRALALAFGIYSLFTIFQYPPGPGVKLVHMALAAFIYFVAGSEEAFVLAEENRRAYHGSTAGDGVWTAPPGYRWVHRGNGVWQLAPIVVTMGGSRPGSATWRR
jgi:hypothetical protein